MVFRHSRVVPSIFLCTSLIATGQLSAGIIFNLNYLDPPSAGFNDPSEGPDRKATLEAVASYIGSVLELEGEIDVNVEESDLAGVGRMATGTTFFDASSPGFKPGATLRHLREGSDPFPEDPDISLQVDFGFTFNSDLGDPAPDEMDLFSLLLQQMTRGLGIQSGSRADGSSWISDSSPGAFTIWDSFLQTGGGQPLWNDEGVFLGTTSDLLGDDFGVVFTGSMAVEEFGFPLQVFTGIFLFEEGFSLGFFDFAFPGSPIMEPFISVGMKKREYIAVDLAALRDIGYIALPSSVDHWELLD